MGGGSQVEALDESVVYISFRLLVELSYMTRTLGMSLLDRRGPQ